MDYEQKPAYEPPSYFARSAALFIFTMGTVFGLGILWTNYGDEIAARWDKDWNSMKESWTQATAPPEKKQRAGLLGLIRESAWSPEGFGYEMRPRLVDSSRLRDSHSVVPVIDHTKPNVRKVTTSDSR